jgi:hypothetical protein
MLLGLLPREQFPDAPLRRAVAQVNRLIRDCADGEYIVYAEIGDALLDSDGRLSVAVSPDWLHFNESGYALLTAASSPYWTVSSLAPAPAASPDELRYRWADCC